MRRALVDDSDGKVEAVSPLGPRPSHQLHGLLNGPLSAGGCLRVAATPRAQGQARDELYASLQSREDPPQVLGLGVNQKERDGGRVVAGGQVRGPDQATGQPDEAADEVGGGFAARQVGTQRQNREGVLETAGLVDLTIKDKRELPLVHHVGGTRERRIHVWSAILSVGGTTGSLTPLWGPPADSLTGKFFVARLRMGSKSWATFLLT